MEPISLTAALGHQLVSQLAACLASTFYIQYSYQLPSFKLQVTSYNLRYPIPTIMYYNTIQTYKELDIGFEQEKEERQISQQFVFLPNLGLVGSHRKADLRGADEANHIYHDPGRMLLWTLDYHRCSIDSLDTLTEFSQWVVDTWHSLMNYDGILFMDGAMTL